jgi:LacI family transcriptional regulator
MSDSYNKPVGIKDIAAKAGVSIGTVDRVLHNRGEVKASTYEKVMAIVEELEYTPNLIAKSLARKKSTQIAIVIPNPNNNNPYWQKPVERIKQAKKELLNYNVEIIYEFYDASNEKSFEEVLSEVYDYVPDGVVVNPIFKETSLKYITKFDNKNIPYVFIDIDIDNVNKLGFFGQNAKQSGRVAANAMSLSTKENSTYLIIKQSNRRIFSTHIEDRIKGFSQYFENSKSKIITIEIDLSNENEPYESLSKIFVKLGHVDGVFIPNSRSYKLADFLELTNKNSYIVIGYDLIEQNIKHLEKENITYLINQKPEEQVYDAIMSIFNYILLKKSINKTNYSSIDILIKENINCYK